MKAYKTPYHFYDVFHRWESPGLESIFPKKGIHKGKEHRIIGFIGPDNPLQVIGDDRRIFLCIVLPNGRIGMIDPASIDSYLEKEPAVGKHVVARLVKKFENGQYTLVPPDSPGGTIITSPIEEIVNRPPEIAPGT